MEMAGGTSVKDTYNISITPFQDYRYIYNKEKKDSNELSKLIEQQKKLIELLEKKLENK